MLIDIEKYRNMRNTIKKEAKELREVAFKIGEKKGDSMRKNSSPIAILRYIHKKRGLGFNPINERFEGSEAHHMDKNTVVFIPAKLHQSIYHRLDNPTTMFKINMAVVDWLWEEWCKEKSI